MNILTISGASAAGKTTIAKGLLNALSNVRMLSSLTTRGPRVTDLRGEYIYTNEQNLKEMSEQKLLLWFLDLHGIFMGTSERSVLDARDMVNTISVMILAPKVIKILKNYGDKADIRIISIYILAPSENILRQRLEERNKELASQSRPQENIEKRIQDCIDWDDNARKEAHLFDYFIRNEGSVDDAVQKVVSIIRQNQPE